MVGFKLSGATIRADTRTHRVRYSFLFMEHSSNHSRDATQMCEKLFHLRSFTKHGPQDVECLQIPQILNPWNVPFY